jgi:hypothetical protein
MEQEAEPTVVSPSGGDHHIVDIQLQPDAAQCVSGSHPPPPTSGNVNLEYVDDDETNNNCCVVCTEPMEWVAIGRCGHRVVCPRCMLRIRFFYRNKRCCICRTYCLRVVVTKPGSDGAITSILPLFAFWEGRVGKILVPQAHGGLVRGPNTVRGGKEGM